MYIDNVFYKLSNTSGSGTFWARNFRWKNRRFLWGMIDEVRFYDHPLTADEITQNFELRKSDDAEPMGKLPTVWGTLKNKF